jgi:hypothetical protein
MLVYTGCSLSVFEKFPIESSPDSSVKPIDTSLISKIVYIHLFDGRTGLRSFIFNDWLIYRQDRAYFSTKTDPIRLESNLALEYICKQKSVDAKKCTWFAVFYSGNMKVLATRRYPNTILINLPELDKAIDNNGKLLKHSREPFFETLIKKSDKNVSP